MLILFTVAFSLPTPGYREERRFLAESGFCDLAGIFEEEEVEIQHILHISDDVLSDLGVHTIGAQIKLRDSAQIWIDLNVVVGRGEPEEEREQFASN